MKKEKKLNRYTVLSLIGLLVSLISIGVVYAQPVRSPSGEYYDEEENQNQNEASRFHFIKGALKGSKGLVSDDVTNLTWESKGTPPRMNWGQAKEYCDNLYKGGYGDWRLPTIKELASIVDYSRYSLAINTYYFGVNSSSYWSSTPYAGNSASAWSLDFYDGSDNNSNIGNTFYVLCTRG